MGDGGRDREGKSNVFVRNGFPEWEVWHVDDQRRLVIGNCVIGNWKTTPLKPRDS
jgi:hypothetical protein